MKSKIEQLTLREILNIYCSVGCHVVLLGVNQTVLH